MPVPQTLDELRASLRQSVDALQRRQANEIPEKLIDRLVDLDWLEWHGGGLRLTTTGTNVHRQELARIRAMAETSGSSITPNLSEADIATPNYSYEKRQRELAKKKKKEEKAQRKASGAGSDAPSDDVDNTAGAVGEAAPAEDKAPGQA